MSKDAIVPVKEAFPVLYDEEGAKRVLRLIEKNRVGESFSFHRLPMPKEAAWCIDGEYHKTITGVIIGIKSGRFFYEEEYTGQKVPPDCVSTDLRTGYGTPGGPCSSCEHSAWGSGPGGRGQSCKQRLAVAILLSNEMIPCVISMPPSSLKAMSEYLESTLVRKGYLYEEVVTELGLVIVDDPTPHAVVKPHLKEVLDFDTSEHSYLRAMADTFDAWVESQMRSGDIDNVDAD